MIIFRYIPKIQVEAAAVTQGDPGFMGKYGPYIVPSIIGFIVFAYFVFRAVIYVTRRKVIFFKISNVIFFQFWAFMYMLIIMSATGILVIEGYDQISSVQYVAVFLKSETYSAFYQRILEVILGNTAQSVQLWSYCPVQFHGSVIAAPTSQIFSFRLSERLYWML